jgi:HD-like signal output (HDOD) protein/GGDEF domain-containing protein
LTHTEFFTPARKHPTEHFSRETMSSTENMVDRLVAKAGQLYSLPAVAMEVLELTRNPAVDARALKLCIENDPALTSKLLRVVNSSLFGLGGQVSDLGQALALLGTKPLKLLVLGFNLPRGLFAGVNAEVLGRYWRHALTKAVAAREFCEAVRQEPGDEAFIAGLLQDLGILVLIQELGEPYVEFFQKVVAGGGDLSGAEVGSIGFDHRTLTARLLDHWGLPRPLVDAVAPDEEGDPCRITPQPLAGILQLAELAAQFVADGRVETYGELLDVGAVDYGLSQDQLETVLAHLEDKVQQLAEVLSLQLPAGTDCSDLLIEAHAQLAGLAEEVSGDLSGRAHRTIDLVAESRALMDQFQWLSKAMDRTPPPMAVDRAMRRSGTATAPADRASAMVAATEPCLTAKATLCRPPLLQAAAVEADPGLADRLAASVAASRHARCPLTLLLIELDQSGDLLFHFGPQGYSDSLDRLRSACHSLDHPHATVATYREHGLAVILPDCDRQQAVQLGNQLLDHVRRSTSSSTLECPGVTVSVGAATVSLPPRNFPPGDLLSAAERCLYGSHTSGGGVVKSIEIY